MKLFIGQVPKNYEAEQLEPIVKPFGTVTEIKIIRDRDTGASKGCAFVNFSSQAEAESCMQGLHNQIQLEGASHPLQVKPSESSAPAAQPQYPDETSHKIFVGQLGYSTNEQDLQALFSPIGEIEEVTILRGNGASKLCGFIRFVNRDSAIQAIASLHGKHQWPDGKEPMTVRFADSDKFKQMRKVQQQSKQLADQANALMLNNNNMLAQMMGNPLAAQLLQLQMQNQFSNPSMFGVMGNQPTGTTAYSGGSVGGGLGGLNALSGMSGMNGMNALYGNYGMPAGATSGGGGHQSQKEGPPGANLFIYHIPNEYTDAHLIQLFSPYGNLLSAKVFVDKATNLSKCFGFVSYDNIDSANTAIGALNGLQLGSKRLKVSVKGQQSRATPY